MWLAVSAALAGQAGAQDTAALMDRLHRASTVNAIDDPQLKPWHLKLSFQLFDAKGKPAERGTIEEWWSGPSIHKTVYTSPSYTSTEIKTKDGLYRTKGMPSVPSLVALVLRQVVNPMPDEKDIADSTPDLRKETMGKVPMDCIMLAQAIKNVANPPLGLFPTYCFDHDKDSLRVSYDFGSQLTARNRIGTFQGRQVVIDQTTILGSVDAITGHVESLETVSLAESEMTPSTDLRKIDSDPVRAASGVVAGLKIAGPPPIYPESAKIMHISGTVILKARIGTDGRIHFLQVVSTPDADLAISSLAAVRQWTYKPYLLNGEPVEVDTQITVNFAFGN
ncbi:MAG: energy transducer TonB [Edaphobacter sp.]